MINRGDLFNHPYFFESLLYLFLKKIILAKI